MVSRLGRWQPAKEPDFLWIVHIHDPYAWRCAIYRGCIQVEGEQALPDLIEDNSLFQGLENVAAILPGDYNCGSDYFPLGEVMVSSENSNHFDNHSL